ncbi:MAG TPA: hypothetical protein VMD28_10350 [Acidimicrobiales bacterium]|nr:hypothetical protein [Acidimicrobiales bacterium]
MKTRSVVILIVGVATAAALALRRMFAHLRNTDTNYWTLRSQIQRYLRR